MTQQTQTKTILASYLVTLLLLIALAGWLKSFDLSTGWKQAGWVNFSFGIVLLAAYMLAKVLKTIHLPLISGYIFAGILAGPYVTGFLTGDMVSRLGLVNDIALSFIALTAGAALDIDKFRGRWNLLASNLFLIFTLVFSSVGFFVMVAGKWFDFTQGLSALQMLALSILLGTIAVSLSPASAIAIISESKAEGPFTDMVLAVIIIIDVIIIVLYSMAISFSRLLLSRTVDLDFGVFAVISVDIDRLLGVGRGFRAGHFILH